MEGKSSDLSKLVRVGVGGTMALIESSKEGALSKTTPTGALSDPTQDAPEETQVEIPKEEQSWIGRLLGTKRRKK
jgi:hypothetical protein